jgi:hypothetical protein
MPPQQLRAEERVDLPVPKPELWTPSGPGRPRAQGRFFFDGKGKLRLDGVTYGTFRPHEEGHQFPDRAVVASDFSEMARRGFNTVRTYTPPPTWLLDLAAEKGLYVFAGLSWTQHVTFLDDRKLRRSIRREVAEAARACAGHPALFLSLIHI